MYKETRTWLIDMSLPTFSLECHVNVLRQDKSIGAFVPCNVRLHLEPWEGGDTPVIYQNTTTGKHLQLNFSPLWLHLVIRVRELYLECQTENYKSVNTKQAPSIQTTFISQSTFNSRSGLQSKLASKQLKRLDPGRQSRRLRSCQAPDDSLSSLSLGKKQ